MAGLLSTAVDTTSALKPLDPVSLQQPPTFTPQQTAVTPQTTTAPSYAQPPPKTAAPQDAATTDKTAQPPPSYFEPPPPDTGSSATSVQPRTVTEPETVAGQLNKLLDKDSLYIQSARNNGMAQANSRGLLNSSLAAGTSEKAAIDAALPIATSDAATYSNSGLSAQQAAQDTSLTEDKARLDAAQQERNFGYNTGLNQQNIQGNLDISKQAQDAALFLKNLDISQQDKASLSNAIGPVIQQYQSEISKIQTTADSVMSPNAKQAAIDFQNNLFKAQLQTMASLYNYNMTWDTPSPNVPGATILGGGSTTPTTPGTGPSTNPGGWTEPQLTDHNFNPGVGYTWVAAPPPPPLSGLPAGGGRWTYGTT
jgi:hypothetical protein